SFSASRAGRSCDDARRYCADPGDRRRASSQIAGMSSSDTRARSLRHTLFTWSAQGGLDPIEIVSAERAHFTDGQGRRILDLASLVLNASAALHHPKIAEAIATQAATLPAAGPAMATEIRGRYGEALASVVPSGLGKFLFTLGGADANEHAIKI